ncbi:MAG: ketoacyl-ACP synthase III [Candidatus Omnitrophica bacterium]|nr:ketoacyl-ACP synthase III [Candidatus Omnitrophota bacterium]
MKKVGVIGVGEYFPKKVLTNFDLSKMVDTSDEWITTRTGIKERRIVAKNEATSDLAIKAAKEALADAGLKAEAIDLIIVASITPDTQFPSVSCLVQKAIGAHKAACFDIEAACAGFVYGIVVAQQFIAAGTYKNVLVVGAEVLSSITDWEDRNTCVLFGDGAGACVLSAVKAGGIISTYLGSDGTYSDLLMLPAGGSRMPATCDTVNKHLHYIKMRGNELFKLAVNIMSAAANHVVEKAKIKTEEIDLFVPHQANVRIIQAVAKKLKISENKVYINIDKYGNTSSASTATALCQAVKTGRLRRGDLVLLDAFGSGLVWGACLIRW